MEKINVIFADRMKINSEILNDVKKITGWSYHDVLEAEEIEDILTDLIREYNTLKEQIEDSEEIYKTYYKKRSGYEVVGMSESDFC